MIDWLKHLEINPEDVSRQAKVAAGLARMYQEEGERAKEDAEGLLYLAAATNFRRAAAHWLLLEDTDEAKRNFALAISEYRRVQPSYANYLAVLGTVQPRDLPPPKREQGAASVYWLWGASRRGTRQEFIDFRKAIEDFRTQPIGALGISVGVYLDLHHAVSQEEISPRQISVALLPIISTFALGLTRFKEDRHHRLRISAPFHPAEPDVLALLVALVQEPAIQKLGLWSLIQSIPVAEEALVVLRSLLQQYEVPIG